MTQTNTRLLARAVTLLALALPFCFVPGATLGPTVQAQTETAAPSAVNATSPDAALKAALGTPALAGHVINAPGPVPTKPAGTTKVAAKPAPAKPKAVAAKPAPKKWVQPAPVPMHRYPTYTLMATAYNSLPNQTDGNPFITATGARTRFGIVALSRDMLRRIPYGSLLRLDDLSGRYSGTFANMTFVVEDTMHPSKYQQIDVWFPAYS
ncbi:MAG TPA: hypothetical protein VHN99_00075, partial [Deinococcales bacterium]|nr:hypothetical protein [Deinococcales bacterium]